MIFVLVTIFLPQGIVGLVRKLSQRSKGQTA
jgi:ABC-type branched-subunit amino acid transport system permease subunit